MATDPNKKVFYVYQHLKADTGEIFYVGKGMGRRAFDKYHRSKYWKAIEAKYGVKVEFVKENISEAESLQLEIETIASYKKNGINLINMTEGGDGTTGYTHTDEHRMKMSVKQSGSNNPRFGKVGTRKGATASAETIERLRQSHLGKKLSEEERKKIRESTKLARQGIKTLGMTGRKHSEETLQKMREKAKGRTLSAEVKEKISQTKKLANAKKREMLNTPQKN